MAAALPNNPKDGHDAKHRDRLGRVKFFFGNPSEQEHDAILICNGAVTGNPQLDEPHFYDGRHRYLASLLRGDATINAVFRFHGLRPEQELSWPVIHYLAGASDEKP